MMVSNKVTSVGEPTMGKVIEIVNKYSMCGIDRIEVHFWAAPTDRTDIRGAGVLVISMRSSVAYRDAPGAL